MAKQRNCDHAVTRGRLAKAIEFVELAESAESERPTAAGDLYVDAGIAAADVICCIRLGVHSTSSNHTEACALLNKADRGSERYLATLLGLKNKAVYTHEPISAAECKKMNRAASHLVDAVTCCGVGAIGQSAIGELIACS